MVRFKLWSHWTVMPAGLRRAAGLSVVIIVAGSALLYQTNVRSERPPVFSRGGAFAGKLAEPKKEAEDLTIQTPTPAPASDRTSRSSAVLQAPAPLEEESAGRAPTGRRLPSVGKYVFAVDGYEEATAFGNREYPSEMTTTIHRTKPTDPDQPPLKEDEVVFDLYFSSEHEEREIVAYREGEIVFTYEAGSVTFGPATRTSEAIYDPAMLQIPIPLLDGSRHSGTSRAINNQGDVVRIEDWVVEVLGREDIEIGGVFVATWVVRIDRQSRPGSSEQVSRSRTYWFDPERRLWVKWEEKLNGAQDFGPGSFSYRTEFTATLKRVEPL